MEWMPESMLDMAAANIAGYEEELRQLSVEAKHGCDGIVGFPAMVDGEIVHLCWKLGESELKHWHPIGGSYADRQQLPSNAATDAGADATESKDSFDS